ncbi:MAG: FAD-dependent oxidoreductase, partial [Chloroflexota bacterium]|nr:FAD-dependent oxidoreductase [Chloroflexota bacterium]
MADALSPGKVVILGNGVASLAAIATLRQRGFGGKITVVSDEPHHAYARMLVPYYVSGRLARDRLFLVAPDYHRSLGVDLVLGSGAVHVDTEGRRVVLAGGGEVPYDRLLVATGSRPTMPAVPGIGGQGVRGLRSMTDAEGISSLVL